MTVKSIVNMKRRRVFLGGGIVQCAITDSPFHDVVYTYCTLGYNGRAGLELHGGHGTEAVFYVAPCLGLGAPYESFPMDLTHFQ